MSFLKRMFSADYRRAVAAEAAGDYVEAARCYAMLSAKDDVARMHLARGERATTRKEELDALRDAVRWAMPGGDVMRKAARALADGMLAKAKAEGIATERDREAVREAARLYGEAAEHALAGETWELLGDDEGAARAYERAGAVDKMEQCLAREEKRAKGARRLREAFEEYELHERAGDRESALSALRRAGDLADEKGDYRRLSDRLESRRIAQGRVVLRKKGGAGAPLVLCGGDKIVLGRDALCELPLRAGGVSRLHAEVRIAAEGFTLRDLDSKNGTLVGGIPIGAPLPLTGDGRFALGEECELAWRAAPGAQRLRLEVVRGLDKGAVVSAAAPGGAIDLHEETGARATLAFEGGRPYVTGAAGESVRLNGHRIAEGRVQLVREDALEIGDVELDVS